MVGDWTQPLEKRMDLSNKSMTPRSFLTITRRREGESGWDWEEMERSPKLIYTHDRYSQILTRFTVEDITEAIWRS